MTHSRREELKKMLPKKETILICSDCKERVWVTGTKDNRQWYCNKCKKVFEDNLIKEIEVYSIRNNTINDCFSALEDKVILRSELLSEGEIDKILIDYKGADTDEIARIIHDRTEGK